MGHLEAVGNCKTFVAWPFLHLEATEILPQLDCGMCLFRLIVNSSVQLAGRSVLGSWVGYDQWLWMMDLLLRHTLGSYFLAS